MIFKIFLIILYLFLPFLVQANIIINEIAWIGTITSANNEWIELYNDGETIVNLDGWTLKADDGAPEINLFGTIPAKGFFLLERTDDETAPGISADLIYKGALGNDGENLKLYNGSGDLIDQIICADAWPAGDNSTKQTMERITSGWQTSKNAGGTPKITNSESTEVRPLQATVKPDEEIKYTEARPLYIYPKGIVFNEILASPDGPDAENEWIEIYNENDFEIDLSGWKIQDTAGKSVSYILNKKILGLGYLVFSRPETKITLNNDGDRLNLINPNGETINSIIFNKALLNQSYSKTSSGWAWNSNLTPGEKNIIPVSPAKSSRSGIAKSSEKPETASQDASNINDINLPAPTQKSQPRVFLIAFLVALFCSIAFLIVKSNLKAFWY